MSSEEVVGPSDVMALKADLIEAVTNAYMAKQIPAITDLKFDHGECKKGEFRYKLPAPDGFLNLNLDPDTGYYCSFPGGDWKEDETWAHDSAPSALGNLFDAAAVYSMIESVVSTWIDPWADGPHPNDFSNQIASIANVAQQLYVGDQIVFGGQEVPPVEGDTAGSGAVTDVRSAIDEVKLNVDDLRGVAIDAFQRTYVLDIERTIGGQRGLATAAGLAITAEGMAWNATYASLRDFLKKATHDFNDYAEATDGSGEDTEATLGAVGAIAGLAGATVGVAFPPFGVAMGVVSGVAGIGGLMFGSTPAKKAAPLALSGGSYDEYWESFKDQIMAIEGDLRDAEDEITDGCRRMVDDFQVFPDNYSIGVGQKTGGQGTSDSLAPFLTSEIAFNYTKMQLIAGAVESIGNHQRDLAGRLGGMDGAGSPSALVSSEWSRGSLPAGGIIGSGYAGPFAAFEDLVDQLVDLLLVESKTAHRIAEHCIEVSLGFKATDEDRESALATITKTFDTVEIPVVNG